MNFRVDKTIKNEEPIYEFYKAGERNPHRWIWFPQYKAGSRTIETHINKTLCDMTWRRDNRPEDGFIKYSNCLFTNKYIEFRSDKPMYNKLGWRLDTWSVDDPVCRTAVAFTNNDTPDKYFKFMFVRNPWDRVVSCWNDRRYSKGKREGSIESTFTFDQYVDHLWEETNNELQGDVGVHGNPHVRSQSSMVRDIKLDFVGKLENFKADWQKVCDHMNVTPWEKDIHQNKTKRTVYTDYYTERTKQIVSKIYAEDIDNYQYTY